MPFVADQAKEALNFAIAGLVLVIIAAMKAKEGIAYRYPFALRLVK